jgi:hypothetical protein
MPLEPGKSNTAFSQNVATEMHAGKPQKQAVAIAYSEKGRTGDMAEGYGPIKGSVSSVAELNLANQRLYGQLEGETTFENTGDANPHDLGPQPDLASQGAKLIHEGQAAEKAGKINQAMDLYSRAEGMFQREKDAFGVKTAHAAYNRLVEKM